MDTPETLEYTGEKVKKKIDIKKFKTPASRKTGTIDKSKFSIFGEVLEKKKKQGTGPQDEEIPEVDLQHFRLKKTTNQVIHEKDSSVKHELKHDFVKLKHVDDIGYDSSDMSSNDLRKRTSSTIGDDLKTQLRHVDDDGGDDNDDDNDVRRIRSDSSPSLSRRKLQSSHGNNSPKLQRSRRVINEDDRNETKMRQGDEEKFDWSQYENIEDFETYGDIENGQRKDRVNVGALAPTLTTSLVSSDSPDNKKINDDDVTGESVGTDKEDDQEENQSEDLVESDVENEERENKKENEEEEEEEEHEEEEIEEVQLVTEEETEIDKETQQKTKNSKQKQIKLEVEKARINSAKLLKPISIISDDTSDLEYTDVLESRLSPNIEHEMSWVDVSPKELERKISLVPVPKDFNLLNYAETRMQSLGSESDDQVILETQVRDIILQAQQSTSSDDYGLQKPKRRSRSRSPTPRPRNKSKTTRSISRSSGSGSGSLSSPETEYEHTYIRKHQTKATSFDSKMNSRQSRRRVKSGDYSSYNYKQYNSDYDKYNDTTESFKNRRVVSDDPSILTTYSSNHADYDTNERSRNSKSRRTIYTDDPTILTSYSSKYANYDTNEGSENSKSKRTSYDNNFMETKPRITIGDSTTLFDETRSNQKNFIGIDTYTTKRRLTDRDLDIERMRYDKKEGREQLKDRYESNEDFDLNNNIVKNVYERRYSDHEMDNETFRQSGTSEKYTDFNTDYDVTKRGKKTADFDLDINKRNHTNVSLYNRKHEIIEFEEYRRKYQDFDIERYQREHPEFDYVKYKRNYADYSLKGVDTTYKEFEEYKRKYPDFDIERYQGDHPDYTKYRKLYDDYKLKENSKRYPEFDEYQKQNQAIVNLKDTEYEYPSSGWYQYRRRKVHDIDSYKKNGQEYEDNSKETYSDILNMQKNINAEEEQQNQFPKKQRSDKSLEKLESRMQLSESNDMRCKTVESINTTDQHKNMMENDGNEMCYKGKPMDITDSMRRSHIMEITESKKNVTNSMNSSHIMEDDKKALLSCQPPSSLIYSGEKKKNDHEVSGEKDRKSSSTDSGHHKNSYQLSDEKNRKNSSIDNWHLLAAGSEMKSSSSSNRMNEIFLVEIKNQTNDLSYIPDKWLLIARGIGVDKTTEDRWISLAQGCDVLDDGDTSVTKYKRWSMDFDGSMPNLNKANFYSSKDRQIWDISCMPISKQEVLGRNTSSSMLDGKVLNFHTIQKITYEQKSLDKPVQRIYCVNKEENTKIQKLIFIK